MSIWKIAYIELKRRIIKTVILLLILTLLFSGVLSALTLLTSAQKSKTDILAKIGATVTLDYAKDYEQPVFSQALLRLFSIIKIYQQVTSGEQSASLQQVLKLVVR